MGWEGGVITEQQKAPNKYSHRIVIAYLQQPRKMDF